MTISIKSMMSTGLRMPLGFMLIQSGMVSSFQKIPSHIAIWSKGSTGLQRSIPPLRYIATNLEGILRVNPMIVD